MGMQVVLSKCIVLQCHCRLNVGGTQIFREGVIVHQAFLCRFFSTEIQPYIQNHPYLLSRTRQCVCKEIRDFLNSADHKEAKTHLCLSHRHCSSLREDLR